MKETLIDLKARRAIRSYTDEPVSKEALDAVLEAGLYAPTARGEQRAVIVAVTNKAVRDELSKMNAAVMGMDADPFYGAPVVCVVFGDGTWPMAVKDGSLVLGNMMNAAHAVGLGSCWIDRAEPVFASERGRALMKEWGVPEGYVGVGHCILGHAAASPEPAPRKEGRVIRVE